MRQKPRLAGRVREKKVQPVFRGDRRKHVLNQVIDSLRDWRSSPFENEGRLRSFLRATMCHSGVTWHRADMEAAALVSEGLYVLGAKRPSWDEGQPDYALGADYCGWCGCSLSEDDEITRPGRRYCSGLCAKAAFEYRDFERRDADNKIYAQTRRIAKAHSLGARECRSCGKSFIPLGLRSEQQFCSSLCYGQSLATLPERTCAQCGTSFRQTNSHNPSRFCSMACYDGYRATQAALKKAAKSAARAQRKRVHRCAHCQSSFSPTNRGQAFCSRSCYQAVAIGREYQNTCLVCGCTFIARRSDKKFCSTVHYQRARKVMNDMKKGKVIYLTPIVFDYVFMQAA